MTFKNFDFHLNEVLKGWPEVIDIEAIGMADETERKYSIELRRSIALGYYYEDVINVNRDFEETSISGQLDWILSSIFSKLGKESMSFVRVREIKRSFLKERLHGLLIKSALPMLRKEQESDGSFDLEEVKAYMLIEGIITPDLELKDSSM